MSLARAIRRGRRLKARFGVNGIHQAERSFGVCGSSAARRASGRGMVRLSGVGGTVTGLFGRSRAWRRAPSFRGERSESPEPMTAGGSERGGTVPLYPDGLVVMGL